MIRYVLIILISSAVLIGLVSSLILLLEWQIISVPIYWAGAVLLITTVLFIALRTTR